MTATENSTETSESAAKTYTCRVVTITCAERPTMDYDGALDDCPRYEVRGRILPGGRFLSYATDAGGGDNLWESVEAYEPNGLAVVVGVEENDETEEVSLEAIVAADQNAVVYGHASLLTDEERWEIDLTDVAAVAALLGVSEDDECTPDGIDWGYTEGPAEGAPVFLLDGYFADDGNNEVHYEHAETGAEAAREYVDGGDWGDNESTTWVRVHTWQCCVSVDADGRRIEGRYDERSHRVEIEPEEPKCAEGGEHDWQSPHDIVGGIEENPGVQGNGGGVVIEEVCMRCGCARTTDTWAQDPEDGTQGLTSVSYERGKYAANIPSREEHELSEISCAELRRGAAHVLSVVREVLIVDTDGGPATDDVPERATAVGEYVRRVSRAVCAAGNVEHERRAIRLALWLAARDQREARAAERVCALAGIAGW